MYGEKLTQSDEWCRVSDVATMNRARRLDVVLPRRVLMAALPPRLFIFPPVQHATSSCWEEGCTRQWWSSFAGKISEQFALFSCTFFTWLSGFAGFTLLAYFSSKMFLSNKGYLGKITIQNKSFIVFFSSPNKCLHFEM